MFGGLSGSCPSCNISNTLSNTKLLLFPKVSIRRAFGFQNLSLTYAREDPVTEEHAQPYTGNWILQLRKCFVQRWSVDSQDFNSSVLCPLTLFLSALNTEWPSEAGFHSGCSTEFSTHPCTCLSYRLYTPRVHLRPAADRWPVPTVITTALMIAGSYKSKFRCFWKTNRFDRHSARFCFTWQSFLWCFRNDQTRFLKLPSDTWRPRVTEGLSRGQDTRITLFQVRAQIWVIAEVIPRILRNTALKMCEKVDLSGLHLSRTWLWGSDDSGVFKDIMPIVPCSFHDYQAKA